MKRGRLRAGRCGFFHPPTRLEGDSLISLEAAGATQGVRAKLKTMRHLDIATSSLGETDKIFEEVTRGHSDHWHHGQPDSVVHSHALC